MVPNETLKALERIVDLMDDTLDVLKDNVSLVQEIVYNGGDMNQTPSSTLATLEGVALALEEVPWILSEAGLAIATAALDASSSSS